MNNIFELPFSKGVIDLSLVASVNYSFSRGSRALGNSGHDLVVVWKEPTKQSHLIHCDSKEQAEQIIAKLSKALIVDDKSSGFFDSNSSEPPPLSRKLRRA